MVEKEVNSSMSLLSKAEYQNAPNNAYLDIYAGTAPMSHVTFEETMSP